MVAELNNNKANYPNTVVDYIRRTMAPTDYDDYDPQDEDYQEQWENDDDYGEHYDPEEYEEDDPDGPTAYWGGKGKGGRDKDDHQFPGLPFTEKVPPTFDGTQNWFTFEMNVRDWQDITKIPDVQQAVRLRLALKGGALVHKPLLDMTKIKLGEMPTE